MQISHMLTRSSFTSPADGERSASLRHRRQRPPPMPSHPTRRSSSPAAPALASVLGSIISYAVTTLSNEMIARARAVERDRDAEVVVPGFGSRPRAAEAWQCPRLRHPGFDGFGSINLLEDGLPARSGARLSRIGADQAFRLDESIDRIEAVRGGPRRSSIRTPRAAW